MQKRAQQSTLMRASYAGSLRRPCAQHAQHRCACAAPTRAALCAASPRAPRLFTIYATAPHPTPRLRPRPLPCAFHPPAAGSACVLSRAGSPRGPAAPGGRRGRRRSAPRARTGARPPATRCPPAPAAHRPCCLRSRAAASLRVAGRVATQRRYATRLHEKGTAGPASSPAPPPSRECAARCKQEQSGGSRAPSLCDSHRRSRCARRNARAQSTSEKGTCFVTYFVSSSYHLVR
jgi:hypothetical protein